MSSDSDASEQSTEVINPIPIKKRGRKIVYTDSNTIKQRQLVTKLQNKLKSISKSIIIHKTKITMLEQEQKQIEQELLTAQQQLRTMIHPNTLVFNIQPSNLPIDSE